MISDTSWYVWSTGNSEIILKFCSLEKLSLKTILFLKDLCYWKLTNNMYHPVRKEIMRRSPEFVDHTQPTFCKFNLFKHGRTALAHIGPHKSCFHKIHYSVLSHQKLRGSWSYDPRVKMSDKVRDRF